MDIFAEYLAGIANQQHRSKLETVLSWVFEQFPDLVPRIAWNQPMFTDHGTFIIGFSVAKQHLAVAPERTAINHFSEDIVRVGYTHSKELIRIPWDHPVEYTLLEKIIAFNIADKAGLSTFWRR